MTETSDVLRLRVQAEARNPEFLTWLRGQAHLSATDRSRLSSLVYRDATGYQAIQKGSRPWLFELGRLDDVFRWTESVVGSLAGPLVSRLYHLEFSVVSPNREPTKEEMLAALEQRIAELRGGPLASGDTPMPNLAGVALVEWRDDFPGL